MTTPPVRYRSADEDSGRWAEFPFRRGDIVISTRSKSGTTWMQMICALLVFQRAELPAPLRELSPWLDWLIEPVESVVDRLDRQSHRRFIKTHTPLDGLPIHPEVDYIVVVREPIDAAVSLHHQGGNLDRARIAALVGETRRDVDRLPLGPWLRNWIDWDGPPAERLDSLVGVMWHITDAWGRRADVNIHLVRYERLLADLGGTMRRLAEELGIVVAGDRWPELVAAASFDRMREQAAFLVPGPVGVVEDASAFFRKGTAGDGRTAVDGATMERYERRLRVLGGEELCAWLRSPM